MTDPNILEALACREAIALARDLTLTHIRVASDCLLVVKDIQTGTMGTIAPIVQEIIDSSREFQSCSFVHERRLSNKEAHGLARHALHLGEGRHVWLLHPHDTPIIPVIRSIDQ